MGVAQRSNRILMLGVKASFDGGLGYPEFVRVKQQSAGVRVRQDWRLRPQQAS